MTAPGHPRRDVPAFRGGATTFTVKELYGAPARRSVGHGPSAWVGLGLMTANTVVALVDLFLLAGAIPR
jgi:hypothetical protein